MGALRDCRSAGVVLALALVAGACTVEPGSFPSQLEPIAVPDAPSPTPGFGLLSDHGVTEDSCAEAVNPDNGCIHLGALVDRSGPFAAFGEAALAGAQAFWHHVNEQGGLTHVRNDGIEAAFDVDVDRYVADNRYDVEEHLQQYDQLAPDVVALALSMGTPMTTEAWHRYAGDDMAAVPISWWSGWQFDELVAESGASYCFQAMNGLDHALAMFGGENSIDQLVVVRTPDRYGEDVLAGVEYWLNPDGPGGPVRAAFHRSEHVVVVEPEGDVTTAVDRILLVDPDVVVLAAGPQVTADLATETAEAGWDGLLVGMAPTFEPSVLEDPEVADVLEDRFVRVAGFGPLTQGGKAYIEMRHALGLGDEVEAGEAGLPDNDAWIAGWVSQYPLHEALVDAVAAGDVTRPGVVEALRNLTVKYDGALPWTTYGGVPNDEATRRVWVYGPDRDAVLGQRLLRGSYVGSTAEEYYLLRPCTDG